MPRINVTYNRYHKKFGSTYDKQEIKIELLRYSRHIYTANYAVPNWWNGRSLLDQWYAVEGFAIRAIGMQLPSLSSKITKSTVKTIYFKAFVCIFRKNCRNLILLYCTVAKRVDHGHFQIQASKSLVIIHIG